MRRRCDSDSIGVYVGDNTDEGVDCAAVCGVRDNSTYRPIVATSDCFLNGVRVPQPGVYCVRRDTSVTRCNTATSMLVAGANGEWSCHPKWPAIFGGEDGGDILVCGGRLSDGSTAYEYRLPPSDGLVPIKNPYDEADRFRCTPGRYVDGPRDHMNNEYIALSTNRFRRIRNNCAKYVVNAGEFLVPAPGQDGYCHCLPTHGKLRRTRTPGYTDDGANDSAAERTVTKRLATDSGLYTVSNVCSPCVVSGDLISTKGVFNFPVACAKSNQRYFGGRRLIDSMPCGRNGFSAASEPACVNTWIYVGDGGMSYLVRRATETI